MNNKLYIIGIGPGDRELILPAASRLIESSDVIIGGRRNLEIFEELDKEKVEIGNNLEEIYSYIVKNICCKKIAVLVTGDPGIYSMMGFLKDRLEGIEIEALPGISSIQYLCSRLKLSWSDMRITSLHGRQNDDLIDIVKSNKKVAIFTGGKWRPDNVCSMLIEKGLANLHVAVGENLSYPSERIVEGSPAEIAGMSFDSLSIMVVQHCKEAVEMVDIWEYETPGLPDDMFIRGDVPMTKEEVRAVSISKLRLRKDSIVCDIGAGTGSVSIECGLRCKNGRVYAVEKNLQAVELISKNIEKFKLNNIDIIEGKAPGILNGLPDPDRVFVGGTGGNMDGILDWVNRFDKDVRVVVNAITIESVYEAVESFQNKGFDNVEIVNVAVSRSRKAGSKHLMQAINPVYVISADKGGR